MTPVFKLADLPAGTTHQIEHGEYKVLLVNIDGEVSAVESKCSHYGLPLENAALCGHRLICPFHHACFNAKDGAQLEAPGLDGLATFGVEVKGEDILLAAEPTPAPSPFSTEPASAPEKANAEHFTYAIVGGGIAAANAVYGIREHDKEGSIALITSEDLPPYDRTKVSKALLAGGTEVADLPLHGEQFYADRGVTLLEKTTVEEADLQAKKIACKGGRTLTYDKVLLATGGKPRKLDIPGSKLGNIFTIRDARDARRVREMTKKGTKVAIIGGSFIGLETAMSLGKQGGKITVITPETTLFEGPFGKEVGEYVQKLHEDAGVTFKLGCKSEEFLGQGSVKAVKMDNGETISTNLVVLGIGVQPATSYVTGLAANDDGGLSVDNHLALNAAGAYAAGDIAEYPGRAGAVRIEHWKVAGQQGRVAGRNMAGHAEPYTMLPYFWSNQQGVNFRYVGHATDYDKVILDGTPGEGPFIAFYVKGEQVQAALGVKRDAEVAVINGLMESGKMPGVGELRGKTWEGC